MALSATKARLETCCISTLGCHWCVYIYISITTILSLPTELQASRPMKHPENKDKTSRPFAWALRSLAPPAPGPAPAAGHFSLTPLRPPQRPTHHLGQQAVPGRAGRAAAGLGEGKGVAGRSPKKNEVECWKNCQQFTQVHSLPKLETKANPWRCAGIAHLSCHLWAATPALQLHTWHLKLHLSDGRWRVHT